MRWTLICVFVLASAHDIISSTAMRPKRDLWSMKKFIGSKLFGTDTVLVRLPDTLKTDTPQLFKIKGYDNVFLKVNRKPKEKEIEKLVKIKYENPIIVNPAMAIIGNYLGTSTPKETLLALEITKNLMKTGILGNDREELGHKVVAPIVSQDFSQNYIIREHVKPLGVIPEERDPIYLHYPDPPVLAAETYNVENDRPIAVYPAEYPPMVVGSEVKYRPLHTKYFYKQESEDADTTYESYDNEGVIVSRTNKVPVKPQYISLRLADVVSIAANPFLIKSQQSMPTASISANQMKETLKVMPIHSYVTENIPYSTPTISCPNVAKAPSEDDYDNFNGHQSSFNIYPQKLSESSNVPDFINHSKLPFDLREHLTDGEIEKLNNFINSKFGYGKNNEAFAQIPFDENKTEGHMTDDPKEDPTSTGEPINPGQIVSRYSYIQLGDESQDATVVRIEDPRLNQTDQTKEVDSAFKLPQNYVYVPPPMPNTNNINANVPAPMTNTDNINQNNPHRVGEYQGHRGVVNDPRISVPIILRADRNILAKGNEKSGPAKTNNQLSLTQNPIVVAESDKQNKVTSNKGAVNTSSGKPFVGGERANIASKPSNIPYNGGPVFK